MWGSCAWQVVTCYRSLAHTTFLLEPQSCNSICRAQCLQAHAFNALQFVKQESKLQTTSFFHLMQGIALGALLWLQNLASLDAFRLLILESVVCRARTRDKIRARCRGRTRATRVKGRTKGRTRVSLSSRDR